MSIENNEEELEINLEEEIEVTPEPEKVEEKPAETLEARKARLERQLEQTNKKLGVTEPKEVKTSKSDSLGYGEKAFLVANGIKGDEIKLVDEAIKKTGDSIEDILANPYFQAKLEETRNLAKTADASPKGSRSNTMPTDSVEYWMGKPIEEVPQEMRIKVVNAKLAKEKSSGTFYNS